jgi:hypothetical protein
VAVNSDLAAGRALAQKIQAGDVPDRFALRDVYRKGWSGLSERDDAERAASLLLDLDWLQEAVEPTAGRDRRRFLINPKVLKDASR